MGDVELGYDETYINWVELFDYETICDGTLSYLLYKRKFIIKIVVESI